MNERKHIEKRLFYFSIITVIVFSLLVIRLFYVQIIKGKDYSLAADKQRIKSVRLYPPRGIIYDRNLIPLTNRERKGVVLLFKELAEMNDTMFKFLEEVCGLSSNKIKDLIENSNSIVEIPVNDTEIQFSDEYNGIIVTEKVSRYHKDNLLAHVIGYTNKSENKGQSGIEKSFDDILRMEEKIGTVMVTLDGKNRLIPGLGYTTVAKRNEQATNSVKLTIDYHIQKIVEDIMNCEKKNGAAIVAEVKTGDILAMVSRPNIDQNDLTKSINSDKNDFLNKAIQHPYPPGSLFKVVVLLTALEEGKVSLDEKFICKGYEEVGNRIVKCHTFDKGGHGKIDIKEAFSHSCNSIFIQLGKRVGGKKIIETAKRLGFGNKEYIGLEEEKEGNLPTGNELLGPAIGNISIGQGSIEVTPLQITSMMLTIANNGYKKDISIVDGIVTEDGLMVKKYNRDKDQYIIPRKYNDIIKECMEKVVTKGTAQSISLDTVGGGGGKTGSAQAIINGKETIVGWFSGYFPENNPRYVITVVIEDAISGGISAAPVFEKIAKGIVLIGK